MDSKDGLHFDSESGIREGIPCEGVIVPSTLEPNPGIFYDAIVIGAGYAGLIATRDLVIRGMYAISTRRRTQRLLEKC